MTPIIHVFAADADKFFVNSFLIETADAVVVIDTQFLVSSATALRARLDALGKPLAGIVITHPHPDHFNGLPILLAGRAGVPVFANAATIDGMRATQAAKRAAWTPVYGDDYPATDALPDRLIGPDGGIDIPGVTLRMIDLGPGESSDITVIAVPDADALIASDLVYNECHPWLAEHRSDAWLAQLDRVEAEFGHVGRVYAGHGPAGGIELFDRQRRYITDFKRLVAGHSDDGQITDDALAAIRAATVAGREGWPLAGLIDLNARAIAEELATPR